MKYRMTLGIVVLVLASVGGIFAYAVLKSGVIGVTLSAQEAEKKWGSRPFDASLFKRGSINERAEMAADLLKKKQLKGLPLSDIQNKLGEFTGYFWNDQIPAYLLNEGWKNDEDVWQLVILPGAGGKAEDIVINKNCCDTN